MNKTETHSMNALEWTILIFMGLLFGGSFLFINIAVTEVPPATLVFVRVAISSVILCGIMALQKQSFRPFLTSWRAFITLGVLCCALPFLLISISLKHIGPGMGAILSATIPLFSVLLGRLLVNEKLSTEKIIGILVGFAGVVLLVGPEALWHPDNETWGALACLGAGLSYALGNFQGHKLKIYPALTVTTATLIVTTVLMLPASLFYDRSLTLPMPSTQVLIAIVWLIVFSTTFSYILYFWFLGRVGATNITLISFITPASAVILGILFKNEQLSLSGFAGMVIIGLSLLIIGGRLRRRNPLPLEENI